MLKPDAIAGGYTEAILDRIAEEGFTVLQQDMRLLTVKMAQEFYREHRDKDFFEDVVDYLSSGPVMALLLAKTGDAISDFRKLLGPTNSETARAEAPNTLRAQFGTDGLRNAVHGSSNATNVDHETRLLFPLGKAVCFCTQCHWFSCSDVFAIRSGARNSRTVWWPVNRRARGIGYCWFSGASTSAPREPSSMARQVDVGKSRFKSTVLTIGMPL